MRQGWVILGPVHRAVCRAVGFHRERTGGGLPCTQGYGRGQLPTERLSPGQGALSRAERTWAMKDSPRTSESSLGRVSRNTCPQSENQHCGIRISFLVERYPMFLDWKN